MDKMKRSFKPNTKKYTQESTQAKKGNNDASMN